jgi:hypothetical protein
MSDEERRSRSRSRSYRYRSRNMSDEERRSRSITFSRSRSRGDPQSRGDRTYTHYSSPADPLALRLMQTPPSHIHWLYDPEPKRSCRLQTPSRWFHLQPDGSYVFVQELRRPHVCAGCPRSCLRAQSCAVCGDRVMETESFWADGLEHLDGSTLLWSCENCANEWQLLTTGLRCNMCEDLCQFEDGCWYWDAFASNWYCDDCIDWWQAASSPWSYDVGDWGLQGA